MIIQTIEDETKKSSICKIILTTLPEWFGDSDAVKGYTKAVQEMNVFAAYEDDKAIGFIAIKEHFQQAIELYVMGVLPEYHRKGIGKALFKAVEHYYGDESYSFITVKTLAETAKHEGYAKTREFYLGLGFIPIEVFPTLWNTDNPCLFLCKSLANKENSKNVT